MNVTLSIRLYQLGTLGSFADVIETSLDGSTAIVFSSRLYSDAEAALQCAREFIAANEFPPRS